jgi:phosphonate transport system substrate-binding protein
MMLNHCRAIVFTICVLLAAGNDSRADDTVLTLGILPYLSHQYLISNFAPLRDYLQQASGQKVLIATAPDFASFRDRTRAGEYDIVITGPHFARLAEMESRFQRVALTRYRIHGVILVAKDSALHKLADLRGKSIAVPPASAIIHMLAIELLHSQGMEPGRDFTLREQANMQNSMVASLRGDSDAGVAGFSPWNSYTGKDMLRVIGKTAEVPGMAIMAHPRVPRATLAKLRKELFAFGGTAAGKAYFSATGYGAWLPIDDASMRSMDPYLRQARN